MNTSFSQVVLVGIDTTGQSRRHFGTWVEGAPWQRFGAYDQYLVLRDDGCAITIPAHSGELVPGSTEDLIAHLTEIGNPDTPHAPMTLELDPTYRCASRDCGGACFSALYRRLAPTATLSSDVLLAIVRDFAKDGGRILRLDGGGDPLLHRDVLSGLVVEHAASYGLKTTILTSGDRLENANLRVFANCECYVRVSLNAGTDKTRMAVHGNHVPLTRVLSAIEKLVAANRDLNKDVPVGATFLINELNVDEVLLCAMRAKDAGIGHFSVRRALGPKTLRPRFTIDERERLRDQLEMVSGMDSPAFRVAVPWRDLEEEDVDPSSGGFEASRCWQSALKVVLEPDITAGLARAQLCGRYRGGGLGQVMQLPALFAAEDGLDWVQKWKAATTAYPISRANLLKTCSSCIDRGFVILVERIWQFVRNPRNSRFLVFHLRTSNRESESWRSISLFRRGGGTISWQSYFNTGSKLALPEDAPVGIASWANKA